VSLPFEIRFVLGLCSTLGILEMDELIYVCKTTGIVQLGILPASIRTHS